MIPVISQRTLVSSEAVESGEFGISYENSNHIMSILRDTLYTDKILAVLREYSSNAWDAHRDAGIGDRPIDVHIPTTMNPTLSIRDFGLGLSREQVFKIYTQYGASTKRTSDTAVGMLGIGSKSGFAYADSFTITSFHGGKKSIYTAVLDASDKGIINLLHEEPSDETGVLIEIAISKDDLYEFKEKASNLFKYFNPLPKCNIEIPKLKTEATYKSGSIYSTDYNYSFGHGWVAVMGCISYRINVSELIKFGASAKPLPHFVNSLSGALFFDIGEVNITASREELKYTEQTKNAVISKMNLLLEEHVKKCISDLNNSTVSLWDKRLRVQELDTFDEMLPDNFKELGKSWVSFNGKRSNPEFALFEITTAKFKQCDGLYVRPNVTLVIRDDQRAFSGFSFNNDTFLVRKSHNSITDTKFEESLAKFCEHIKITGVKVVKTSTLPWVKPVRATSVSNSKHRAKLFKWLGNRGKPQHPYSDHWMAEDRIPTDQDVYVELESFKVLDLPDWSISFRSDENLAKQYNKKMPTVYGYKVTKGSPSKKRKGIHYSEWRETFMKDLFKDASFKTDWELWKWYQASDVYGYYDYRNDKTKSAIDSIVKVLGAKHTLAKYLIQKEKNKEDGCQLRNTFAEINQTAFKEMNGKSEAEILEKKLFLTYPLFSINDISLKVLTSVHADLWIQYVQLVDKGSNV